MRQINPFIEPDWPAPANVLALSTTRAGGHSGGRWRGFNLARHVGDRHAAVSANRLLLSTRLPAGSRLQWLQQVHGSRVVEAGQGAEPPVADGSWTAARGVACAVLTADCLPVLLCDRRGSVVAAVHAGWRGLVGGVLETGIAAMGREPQQLLAWLGPAIGPTAFEVGAEVREAFLEAAGSAAAAATAACFVPGGDRYFADLYELARIRLVGQGLPREAIHGGNDCTYGDPQRFFSYRRDGATGRMASLILLRE